MTEALLVYVTVPDRACALDLARAAVEGRLAACANIVDGMTSLYRWEGRLQEDNELILLLKTRADMFEKLEEMLRERHPYECPCIVALPLVKGSAPYLDWINDSLKKDG